MTNEIALKPCRFCGKPPGTKVGPPALARCITPECEGKSLGAETFEAWNTRAPAQGDPVATEQIDAGAQALANDVWHPPQKLENMTGSEANKFRRQARIVLVAALSLVKP